MAQDLGGFAIARSTSVTMLLIFSVYSIIIVGFGFYVKAQARKGGSDNLASFLTGGGNIGAFSIAMIAATNAMSGGSMGGAARLHRGRGPAAAQDLYRTLAYLNKEEGIAIVMVTHDIQNALQYATTILHAGHGQWFCGTTAEYLASPWGKRFGGEGK